MSEECLLEFGMAGENRDKSFSTLNATCVRRSKD